MAFNVPSLAAVDGEACDDLSHAAGRDASQPTTACNNAQYQLIATVCKNSREQFRVARRKFKNFHGVEIRVFRLNGKGAFVETSRSVALRFKALPDVIAALQSAFDEVPL